MNIILQVIGARNLILGFLLVVITSILELSTYSIIVSTLFNAIGTSEPRVLMPISENIYLILFILITFYLILIFMKFETAKLSFRLANTLVETTSENYMQTPSRLDRASYTALSASDSNYLIINAFIPIFMFLSEIFILTIIFSFLFYFYTISMVYFSLFLIGSILVYIPLIKYVLPRVAESRRTVESNRIQSINEICDLVEYASNTTVRNFLQKRLTRAQDRIRITGSVEYLIQVFPKYLIEITIFLFIVVTTFIFDLKLNFIFFATLLRAVPSMTRIIATSQSIRISLPIFKKYLHNLLDTNDVKPANHITPSVAFNISALSSAGGQGEKSFDLDITFGELVVIKGVSGVGKSTFLRNISKRSSSALITQNSSAIPLSATALEIAYVPQEVNLLNGTVLDNISLGREVSRPLIVEMLKKLGMHEVFQSNDPLEEKIGPSYRNLSVGQRQRLGLIRALIFSADLILLDEFTSALDEKYERAAIELLLDYSKNSAVIAIMHKPTLDHLATRMLIMT